MFNSFSNTLFSIPTTYYISLWLQCSQARGRVEWCMISQKKRLLMTYQKKLCFILQLIISLFRLKCSQARGRVEWCMTSQKRRLLMSYVYNLG